MIPEETIPVRSSIDVVTARMQVREAARKHGLNLTDQARISMATSSLASQLFSSGEARTGCQVIIEFLVNGHRVGLRVTLRWRNVPGITVTTSNERWMVDEIDVHPVSDDIREVTMIKWSEI